jgi:type II secretory pathway component PulF
MNQPASRWALPIVLVAAILHLALWLLLVREVMFTLPAAERTFADYNMKVPALTELCLSFFRVAEKAPAVWFVLPIVDAIVLVVLYRQRQLLLLILWSVFLLILLALALGALEFGIQLAMFKLQEGLSRSLPGR